MPMPGMASSCVLSHATKAVSPAAVRWTPTPSFGMNQSGWPWLMASQSRNRIVGQRVVAAFSRSFSVANSGRLSVLRPTQRTSGTSWAVSAFSAASMLAAPGVSL
jgi:hypothetical protein